MEHDKTELADHSSGRKKVRQILCLISAHPPEANYEVLKLCQKYRGGDVVGMDMAGDENCADFGEKVRTQTNSEKFTFIVNF